MNIGKVHMVQGSIADNIIKGKLSNLSMGYQVKTFTWTNHPRVKEIETTITNSLRALENLNDYRSVSSWRYKETVEVRMNSKFSYDYFEAVIEIMINEIKVETRHNIETDRGERPISWVSNNFRINPQNGQVTGTTEGPMKKILEWFVGYLAYPFKPNTVKFIEEE
jgi:hypothetical protein